MLNIFMILLNSTRGFMVNLFHCARIFSIFCLGGVFVHPVWGGELAHTIDSIKPAIVGIASFKKTRSPAVIPMGTGFVVGDGLNVITNAHVILDVLDSASLESPGAIKESLRIISGRGVAPEFREAVVVAVDKEHDIAQLKISGTPLPVMELGDSGSVKEGQSLAFTGFPIGMILGFYPVTHRGMVSAITPVVMPALSSAKLELKTIAQLKKSAFAVFQLDGTAYPGSSGSPLYDPETGVVYGIINMVYVKGLKEAALSQPSGISYAIPGNFIRDMLRQNQP